MLDLNTVSQSIICHSGGGSAVVTCPHLHRVGQRRVQHHEHGQVGPQIRHHAATHTLTTQITQHVSV